MKTKLLKKIRKKYSIVHYPNGRIDESGKFIGGEWMTLFTPDWLGVWHFKIENNFSEIYDEAYKRMLRHIRYKYNKYGTRRKKNVKTEKLWWK